MEKGQVYIITNAAPGWVEYSANTYYPKLNEIIKKVTIISARGLYEKAYPNNSKQWKIQTFLDIQKCMRLNLLTNFICIGDSNNEIEASQIFTNNFSEIFLKTIKFKENPKPDDLVKQLKLVIDQFNMIYSKPTNLTITVEKKIKHRSN